MAPSIALAAPAPEPPNGSGSSAGLEASTSLKFANAVKLYKNENFEAALPLFRELLEATASPNARLYLGYCLAQLGKHVEAYQAFARTIKETSERGNERYAETREAAQGQLAFVNVLVGRVVIAVSEAPAALTVTLDGTPVDPRELGSMIVVEPGTHRVRAIGDGVSPVERDASLEGGEVKTLTLSFQKSPAISQVPEPATRTPPTDRAAASDDTLRTAGYVAAGAGAAGLALFAITGLMAKSAFDDLGEACGAGPCADRSHQNDVDRGKSLQTVANVSLVFGAVAATVGGTLFVLGITQHENRGPSVSWSEKGGVVSYTGTF